MNEDVTTTNLLSFMQEHVALKDDLERFATKEDLMTSESRVLSTVDRFVKLHETFDHKLVAMRGKYERLEERLEAVERKLGFSAP